MIDRDSLKHQIIETYEYEFPTASGAFDEFVTKIIPNIINNAPTIDAVPVVRGEWIAEREGAEYCEFRCSGCDGSIGQTDQFDETEVKQFSEWYKYCPYCGAKMDGERKDGDSK